MGVKEFFLSLIEGDYEEEENIPKKDKIEFVTAAELEDYESSPFGKLNDMKAKLSIISKIRSEFSGEIPTSARIFNKENRNFIAKT